MAPSVKEAFKTPNMPSSASAFFFVITAVTAVFLYLTLSNPLDLGSLISIFAFIVFMSIGLFALIGIKQGVEYELRESALVVHQALQTETILYDRIEEAQLDTTVRRGFNINVLSGVRPWVASTKSLSKMTVQGILVGLAFKGGKGQCVNIKLKDSRNWLILFFDDRSAEFHRGLLRHLNVTKPKDK